jgi:hypothetical protein
MPWLYENWSGELYAPDGWIFTDSLPDRLSLDGTLDVKILPQWIQDVIGSDVVAVTMAGTEMTKKGRG